MPRNIHWFDFETTIRHKEDDEFPVTVEATISSFHDDVELESFKVFVRDTDTEMVVSDTQLKDITNDIWERINDPGSTIVNN